MGKADVFCVAVWPPLAVCGGKAMCLEGAGHAVMSRCERKHMNMMDGMEHESGVQADVTPGVMIGGACLVCLKAGARTEVCVCDLRDVMRYV